MELRLEKLPRVFGRDKNITDLVIRFQLVELKKIAIGLTHNVRYKDLSHI